MKVTELERLGEQERKEWIDRFKREIEVTAKLEHPNIVPVYEAGECEGKLFYSMQYIPGDSLKEALKKGLVEGRLAAKHMEAVARALHYAHCEGVIHRDVKPANILVDSAHAKPLIFDFGLAKRARAPELTRSGGLLGTPWYAAPEQIKN